MTNTHFVHLISNSTGETLLNISHSVLSRFDDINYEIITWTGIKNQKHIKNCINFIKQKPGFVLYTLIDDDMIAYLKNELKDIENTKIISPLDYIIAEFAQHLQKNPTHAIADRHKMDQEYFKRMDAINFTYDHDDGRLTTDIQKADIILLGVSRTSKTPTSLYLAQRGLKVINIPFTQNTDFSILDKIIQNPKILIIALTIDHNRLQEIRTQRMKSDAILSTKTPITEYEKQEKNKKIDSIENKNNYNNIDYINKELTQARKLYSKLKCPIIDVTNKSVEEVAAMIMRVYNLRMYLSSKTNQEDYKFIS